VNVANLETLVPGLAEARQAERQNRSLAFAGLTHTLCGVEVMPLTPRHRLALQLLRNAFTTHIEPMQGDVFQFLWLLSPGYISPLSGRRMAAEWRQMRLRRHVRKLDVLQAVREIKAYIVAQLQDMSETSAEGSTDFGPWVHWLAYEATFYVNVYRGFTLESYLQTPYLVLQQLQRAWRINNPKLTRGTDGSLVEEEPQFINASDRLVSTWQRARAKEVADYIRNQRERLPS
jgi:hypothetical protein